jgi:GNAT superfamily N-acetyltransferase
MNSKKRAPRLPAPARTLVRPVRDADRARVDQLIEERWGTPLVAVHHTLYRPSELPGFLALVGGKIMGLVTFRVEAHSCEIVSLDAIVPRTGIGTILIEAVAKAARLAGCRRLWLVTTNDNLDALRFYLRRGFRLAAVHPGAVDDARRLKPSIPELGDFGIPIHDELELEQMLGPAAPE